MAKLNRGGRGDASCTVIPAVIAHSDWPSTLSRLFKITQRVGCFHEKCSMRSSSTRGFLGSHGCVALQSWLGSLVFSWTNLSNHFNIVLNHFNIVLELDASSAVGSKKSLQTGKEKE